MRVTVIAFLVCLMLWGVAGCVAWRWASCRSVGHTALYCAWDLGRD